MKLSIIILLAFFCTNAWCQTTTKPLRYFSQTGPSPVGETQYGNNPKAGHYVQSGDAKIYYEVYGKGKPVVLLHGGIFGSTYEMYQLIDSLKKTNLVIAVSTRGHGKSAMGAGIPSYEQKAEDAKAVVNAVTEDSVTVLGFSDGAYTGYYFAATTGNKVKKLIAIGAGEWKKGFWEINVTRQMFFSMDSLYTRQQMALMPEPARFDEWLETINKYYNSLSVGKEIFTAIHCPVLVMAGERDMNAPLATIIAAYQMIPNSQLAIIPAAPHPVFLVNFPAVWSCIVPFLKQ